MWSAKLKFWNFFQQQWFPCRSYQYILDYSGSWLKLTFKDKNQTQTWETSHLLRWADCRFKQWCILDLEEEAKIFSIKQKKRDIAFCVNDTVSLCSPTSQLRVLPLRGISECSILHFPCSSLECGMVCFWYCSSVDLTKKDLPVLIPFRVTWSFTKWELAFYNRWIKVLRIMLTETRTKQTCP